MALTIEQRLEGLLSIVSQAEMASEASKPARSLRDALVRASEALRPWVEVTPEATALSYFTDSAVESLKTTADGFDREAGAMWYRRVKALLEGDFLDDDPEKKAQAEALIERWGKVSRSTTGGGRRSGESAVSDLGFTVKVKDESTGETVGSTTKDNLNSLRDQVRKHHAKAHGTKPSKGEPVWQGVTDALEAVMHKGTQSAQGGGYLVDKAAA